MNLKLFITFFVFIFLVFAGCNDDSSEPGGSEPGIGNLGVNAQISDCGGFDTEKHELSSQATEDSLCSNERLIWQYDQESHTVKFLNKDVWLNCCGEHSITSTVDEKTGMYIIEEIDSPEFGMGRCHCMCFFDFKINLPNIESGALNIELYRHVTDEGVRTMIWKGELDLNNGEGDELIRENIGWCD